MTREGKERSEEDGEDGEVVEVEKEREERFDRVEGSTCISRCEEMDSKEGGGGLSRELPITQVSPGSGFVRGVKFRLAFDFVVFVK